MPNAQPPGGAQPDSTAAKKSTAPKKGAPPEHAKPNDTWTDEFGRYVRYVLALGHAWQIKAALQRARLATLATLAGAGLVIVGAVLFFIATGSNGPAYVPVMTTTPTAVPTTTPTTVP